MRTMRSELAAAALPLLALGAVLAALPHVVEPSGDLLLDLGLCGETVSAAEVTKLGGGDLELVGDPRVRASLADPGADLVQLCA